MAQALAGGDVQQEIQASQHQAAGSVSNEVHAGAEEANSRNNTHASLPMGNTRTTSLTSRPSAHSSNMASQLAELDADADGEADDFPTEDLRPSKRQRVIDNEVDLDDADVADVLDDEAVLALAAHNSADVFSPDEV